MSPNEFFKNSVKPSQRPESQIERLLALRRLTDKPHTADVFTTIEALKCPPWGRGAYGGQLVGQALLASYKTVPSEFAVHSIHCHFLTAADVDLPVTYAVQRAYDGRSFVTRAVQAKQHDRLVMSATASFARVGKVRPQLLNHAAPMPSGELSPDDDVEPVHQSAAGQGGRDQLCDCVRSNIRNQDQSQDLPSDKRLRQWIRVRGRLGKTPSDACGGGDLVLDNSLGSSAVDADKRGGDGELKDNDNDSRKNDKHWAHVAAVAYMSDNYFIGTAFRVHNASRFSNRSSPHPSLLVTRKTDKLSSSMDASKDSETLQHYFEALAHEEVNENKGSRNEKVVEMMVTLNHTIFFHNPTDFRADEWLLAEMESPWAGKERALVFQRIWSHQGTLVATCIQEGVVRLLQPQPESKL